MAKIKLEKQDVILGEPIPWNIYRSDGSVVLKKGITISSEENLDKLITAQLMRDANNLDNGSANDSQNSGTDTQSTASKKPGNPFEWINFFALSLKSIFNDIIAGKADAKQRIQQLAANISKLEAGHHDVFLGAIHTYYPQTYSLMQPIYSALLSDLTAEVLEYPTEQRLSLRCAALTANLGMYRYQDKINDQISPLTENQRGELHLHPYQSVQMLKSIGVTDDTWLNAIAHHHEKNDGSGYPAGITSNTIEKDSKIIALADSYLAMITSRAYSEEIIPKVALQQIYKLATEEDQTLYLAFIKTLGIFPPGTYVKLANGEIAIVTQRSLEDTLKCKVVSIYNKDMKAFNVPIERDTSNKEHAIKEFFAPSKKLNLDPLKLWGYQ